MQMLELNACLILYAVCLGCVYKLVQGFIRAPKQGFAFHEGAVDNHRDTSPIIFFSQINQEILAKCVLSWNTWCDLQLLVISVAECRRWRELYQTGKTVPIHITQDTTRLCVCYGFGHMDYGPAK